MIDGDPNEGGITLVELVVTLAIVVIVLSMAIPAFKGIIENNRLAAYTNWFLGAIYLARSEAIKRGVTVALCKRADGVRMGMESLTRAAVT